MISKLSDNLHLCCIMLQNIGFPIHSNRKKTLLDCYTSTCSCVLQNTIPFTNQNIDIIQNVKCHHCAIVTQTSTIYITLFHSYLVTASLRKGVAIQLWRCLFIRCLYLVPNSLQMFLYLKQNTAVWLPSLEMSNKNRPRSQVR